MPNLVRNDLTIEGANVKEVLDAIGFNTAAQPENVTVLIDFDRIVPRPINPPECPADDQGRYRWWSKWFSDNWGTKPYDGAQPGDIFESTDTKVSFKVYTCWTPAYIAVEKLAKRFHSFKFHLISWDQTNHREGEARWEAGRLIVFVPMYGLETLQDRDEPAFRPVTDGIRATAAQLVRSAVETYPGPIPLAQEEVEAAVARALALSGRPTVRVQFESKDEGAACLCVYANSKNVAE